MVHSRHGWLKAVLATLAAVAATAPAEPAPRWARLDGFLQQATAAGGFPGALAVVEHRGQTVYRGRFGHADLARRQPLADDAIFRIYSMTKPVASVAVLMLLEEGRLSLDDPLARWLPEFAGLRQVVGGSADAPQLAPPQATLTLRHLLTHTSGWAIDGAHPAAGAALAAADLDHAGSLQEVATRLAAVPLADAPGTHFHYEGANTELLARVVELASGQPFAAFLQERIFAPLGMADTGFEVPAAQRHRVVELATSDDAGRLQRDGSASAQRPGVRLKPYDSAAGGLYSTLDDYLAFARMLLNDGRAGDRQLLSRKTVELMLADQLGADFGAPIAGFSRGEGFGLGGYVVTDPAVRGRLGSVGQFGWSGIGSTYFTVDRHEHVIAILMMQYLPHGERRLPSPATLFYNLVYQAIP